MCDYRDEDVKRRPASHSYVMALENRVAWLESFVSRLKIADAGEREESLRSVSFRDHLSGDAAAELKTVPEDGETIAVSALRPGPYGKFASDLVKYLLFR